MPKSTRRQGGASTRLLLLGYMCSGGWQHEAYLRIPLVSSHANPHSNLQPQWSATVPFSPNQVAH